jgi:hypothetical protein
MVTSCLTRCRIQRAKRCEDNNGHYFNTATRQVYENSQNARPEIKRNTTVHQVRTQTLKAGVCTAGDDNPYTYIHGGLEKACEEQNAVLKGLLKDGIDRIFQDMAADLDRMEQTCAEQEDRAIVEQHTIQMDAAKTGKETLSGYRDWLVRDGIYVEPTQVTDDLA